MSHHLLQSEMKTNAFKTKILKEALIRVNIWSYKKMNNILKPTKITTALTRK